ncbi:MAG TPA: hypothetical protein VJ464_11265 [Blastocatellia bacterium]|nr:hypothetical protein [Blastocatellia bacterium]
MKRFPGAERIITPGWEPAYDGELWRNFLTGQGYAPHKESTFVKFLVASDRALS